MKAHHKALRTLAMAALFGAAIPSSSLAARNPDLGPAAEAEPVVTKDETPDRVEAGPSDEVSPPVAPGYRLSSPYGYRRSGRTGLRTFHAGVDFAAPLGAPVLAVRTGVVVRVFRDAERGTGMSGYGNAVLVYFKDEDLWLLYAHLDEVLVKPGVVVTPGETLGRVGRTSNGEFPRMGAHLHFEIRERTPEGRRPFPGPYRANNIDPRPWLASHGVVYGRRGRLDLDGTDPEIEVASAE